MESTSTPKIKKPMTKDEVMAFVNLIASDQIITSKETNAASNKLKEEAWNKLTNKFNAKCGSIPRTKDQLKLKWDNLKKTARKRAQSARMNMMKTGGGKSEYIPPDEILDKVTGMMGSTCTGFSVPFGGDGDAIEDLEFTIATLDSSIENTEELPISAALLEPVPEENPVKKRKINPKTKFLYGMPMSKSLENTGRRAGDGRREKNFAIANYYNRMAEKVEIEILLLKEELEKKRKE